MQAARTSARAEHPQHFEVFDEFSKGGVSIWLNTKN